MTPEQKALARHALGLPHRSRKSWRNHFVADEGSADYETWRQLVELGFARRRAGNALSGGGDVFWLTRAGADRAIEPGEKLGIEHFPKLGAH